MMVLIQPRTPHDVSTSRVVDQRVREWTMHLDADRRREAEASTTALPGYIHPYVAISRETGTGGAALAGYVASLLNWEVLHREILDLRHTSLEAAAELIVAHCRQQFDLN
ncbi:MAG: hypothetical protein ACYC3X_23265 [Pirellulaceae bacterium]